MAIPFRHGLGTRPARNIILLFAFTILLPGLILAAFGVLVLEQDRQIALSEIDQRLDLVSRETGETFDRELRATEVALQRVAMAGGINPAELPRWMQDAAVAPGNLAIALSKVAVWPAHSVAYLPWDPDHASAGSSRARWLSQLAQNEGDRGRTDQASRRFGELIALGPGVAVGSVPADLVGRFGLCELAPAPEARGACAVELHRALTHGAWLLEKPSYLWYRSQAEAWRRARRADPAIEADLVLEGRRAALADALVPDGEGGQNDVVLVRPGGASRTSVALAIRREWIHQEWWPRLVDSRVRREFEAVLSEADQPSPAPVPSGARNTTVRTTRHSLGDHRWRVDLRPRNVDGLLAASSRRRTAYTGVLAGVLSLLVFGTYFTSRLVRRELEVARMKSDFVSAVSHEFRSPLTGIRQLSELLMRGRVTSDERRQEYYQRIAGESDRLTRVVENILDFSRMEDGRKPYRFESMDTTGWLREVTARIERTLQDGQHRLVASIPNVARVAGDRDALTTAIDNLVDNAVKYSPGAETVWLTAEDHGSTVAIHVRDAGHGIDAADRPHIFDRFYRGGSEMTRTTKGTGIGLSLVDHIVRAHRGRIDVVSRPGEGSTFTIVLPSSDATAPQPGAGA
jgi:signal transduction histidine kinase